MHNDTLASARIRAVNFAYAHLAKPIYFRRDPERVHNDLLAAGSKLGSSGLGMRLASAVFDHQDGRLAQQVMGIRFRNPVGLSAGFDKNGTNASIMASVGFGFSEVGSVTRNPCAGNPGTRLKRLPEDRSIWVHLGLNNDGADAIHERLWRVVHRIPICISVAKTNSPETKDSDVGLADYLYTVKRFGDVADMFDLNISCPNAFGAKDFADPSLFEQLASGVMGLRPRQPILVKLSPDLDEGNMDRIVEIAADNGISGFICTNLTERHGEGSGGLSGKRVEAASNGTLSYISRRSREMGARFTLVGVGGIFSAEDAYRKIRIGASLVELITGMIYEGPGLIGAINLGLAKLLERDGFSSISQAVGADAR